MILIDVTKNDAKVTYTEKLTSGTVGQKCQFNFSEEWNDLSKIAVCVCGSVIRDVIVDESNAIEIPWEVLAKHGKYLDIGVYGTDGNGEKAIPTIYATVGAVCKGADPSGDEGVKPTPTIWEQILSLIKNVPYTIDAMGKAIFHGHAESASADEKGNTIHSHYMSVDDSNKTFCNVLTETVEGVGAVRLDGVSPIEHRIDVNTEDVKSYGKNLFNFAKTTANNYNLPSYPVGMTLTISIRRTTTSGTVQFQKSTDGVTYTRVDYLGTSSYDKASTFTVEEGCVYRVNINGTALPYVESVQVELGTRGTEHEEYKEPIEGVVQICPTTTLIANTEGTTIKATYNKDINHALAELQNALLNLGGTL